MERDEHTAKGHLATSPSARTRWAHVGPPRPHPSRTFVRFAPTCLEVHGSPARGKIMERRKEAMREPKPSRGTGDEIARWDGATTSHELVAPSRRRALRERLGKRLDAALSRVLELFARR